MPKSCCSIDLVEMLQGKEAAYENLYMSFATFCNENAELRIISNAGHEINKEAPMELSDILNQFYRKI